MNNYGSHDARRYRLPDDGAGARDDASRPYKSDWVAPGRSEHTKHIKAPMPEVTIDGVIETILDALRSGQGNTVENWYKLGCAYLRKGDRAAARLHFEKAAEYNHADACEALVKMGFRAAKKEEGEVVPQPRETEGDKRKRFFEFVLGVRQEKQRNGW